MVIAIDDNAVGDYGAVLRPDWYREMSRVRHPVDGSPVFTAPAIGPPARSRAGPRPRPPVWVPPSDGTAPVVLLHGVGNSGAVFGPVLSALAGEPSVGVVVAPTLSPRLLAAAGTERDELAEPIVEWLTQVTPPPWRLVGHSMGGVIAGLIMRAHPEMVSRAVLLNSPLPGVVGRIKGRDTLDRTGRALLGMKALARITAFGRPRVPTILSGPELTVVRTALRGYIVDPAALDDEVIRRAVLWSRTTDGNEFLRLGRRLPDWGSDPFEDVPVSIVLGSGDPLVPPSDLDAVMAAYPAARLHVLERCGHFAHLERPRRTVELIAGGLTRAA